MDGVSVILGIIVAATAIYLVIRPLLVPEPQGEENPGEWEEAWQEKEGLLAALAEMEQDYLMGKISAEDFAALQESYQARALETRGKKGAKKAKTKAAPPLEDRVREELERELERELAEIRKKARKS